MLVLEELKEKLSRVDELTLLELLEKDSSHLVEVFEETIIQRFEELEGEVGD
jgi:hypothetical protein